MVRMRIATLCLSLVLAACTNASGEEQEGLEARLPGASQGLCDAQVLASEANVPGAAAVFDGEVHGFLHELAAVVQQSDRTAAADLLEAKQRVERAFEDPARAPPQQVVVLLSELQRALGQAAKAAGLPTPLCREGAS